MKRRFETRIARTCQVEGNNYPVLETEHIQNTCAFIRTIIGKHTPKRTPLTQRYKNLETLMTRHKRLNEPIVNVQNKNWLNAHSYFSDLWSKSVHAKRYPGKRETRLSKHNRFDLTNGKKQLPNFGKKRATKRTCISSSNVEQCTRKIAPRTHRNKAFQTFQTLNRILNEPIVIMQNKNWLNIH